ncbi:hypothetical protein Agabi119p4_2722 [Agaricus bisporus var. burnettii]|uniref:Uncharacterized protein n=1 Tax=Agaricus bisporus var. burnettii TaxID=192524 RepID=A0A8H7KKC5_AGABI|nr:hypothetical protein Agabi119p4_2722 [Agaricus bisporus var. burnettii]
MSRRRSSRIRGHTTTRGSSRGSAHSTPANSQDSTPAGSRLGSPAFPVAQTGFPRPVTPPPVNEDEDSLPPVIISPIKKRAPRVVPGIKKLSDSEVWDMDDVDIIAAAFHNARSSTYNHYDTSVDRVMNEQGNKVRIDFVFTCKSDPTRHLPNCITSRTWGQVRWHRRFAFPACSRGISHDLFT